MWGAKASESSEDNDIYCLANRLPETSPVRQMALQQLCGISLPSNAAETLLKIITLPCWLNCKEQELAAILLGRLSLDRDEVVLNAILALTEASFSSHHLGNRLLNRAVARALPPILAALTPVHYGHLPDAIVPHLCKMLSLPDDALVMRVLEALEKMGDGRAVSAVAPIVTQGRTAAIRTAVQRILPILQERQQRENEQSMLLRASSAPAVSPEELLRPATHSPETKPETLLRASELQP